jgi:DNA-binding MarR family transcriptional regulator
VSAQELSELMAPLWSLLNRRSSQELFQIVSDLESSFSQVKMLFLLQDGAEHSVKEIGTQLGLSIAAASRSIDGLAQKGYVSRRESETDRRSKLVSLSDQGREIVNRVLEARLRTLQSFADDLLPNERDQLHAALLPIVERLAPQ